MPSCFSSAWIIINNFFTSFTPARATLSSYLVWRPLGEDSSSRLIALIVRVEQRFPNLQVVRGDSPRPGATHLHFPGKDAHRVHFNPRGHPDEICSRDGEKGAASTRGKRREEKRYGCTYADGGLRASDRGIQSTSRARTTYCHVRWPAGHFNISAECNAENGSVCSSTTSQKGYEKGGGVVVTRPPPVLPGGESWGLFFTSFLRPRRRRRVRPGTAGVKSISERLYLNIFVTLCSSSFFFLTACRTHYLKTFVKRL